MRFFKKIFRWFKNIRIYKYGIILSGDTNNRITGEDMHQILIFLQPGDIILQRQNTIGERFKKGYWTSAALYIGNWMVLYASSTGIKTEYLLTYLFADNISIYRKENPISGIIRAKQYKSEFWNEFNLSEMVIQFFEYIFKIKINTLDSIQKNSEFKLIWKKSLN